MSSSRRGPFLVRARHYLAAAAFLSLVWLVLELSNQRENVAFLSGTSIDLEQAAFGAVYMLSWFGLVLLAPILAIAGILTAVSERALLHSRRVASSLAPWSLHGRDEVPPT